MMPVFRLSRLSRAAQRIGAGLLLASLVTPVLAAPSPISTAPIELQRALRAAWQAHPTALATDATLAAARARADAAGQPLYNPELVVSADDEGTDRTTTAGFALTLDVSGKRRARRDAASAQLQADQAEARLRRTEFAASWLSAWAGHQSAAQRVAQGERRLALIARFAELAEKQLSVGDISSLERDLAVLALDEAQAEQANLLADLAQAQEAFTNVGGQLNGLAWTPAWSAELPNVTPDALRGWESLPEWQMAQASAEAADRRITVARRDRIADPTVALTGGRINYGPVSDNVVGVSVSVPLFVRNPYRAEVVAAQGDADAADAQAQRVRMELENRAKRAATSYAAVQRAWNQWRRSRGTQVDERADLLERLWRAGELSTADYLLQLKQTLDTALVGADLEGRLWQASTDYLAATAQLERWLGLDDATGDVSR